MDHISIEIVRNFLKENNLELKSTQNRLSYPIIERIFYRLKANNRFDLIKIDRERERIVNGHHRYVCYNLLGLSPIENIPWTSNHTSVEYLWSIVTICEEDFDTAKDIKRFKEQYGEINIIPSEIISKITNFTL